MPNELTDTIMNDFEPKMALVIYSYRHDYYVESHPISGGKIMEGRPLEEEQLKDIADYFNEKIKRENAIYGLIPSNLIYSEWSEKRKMLIWFNPPQKRKMFFSKNLEIPNGEAWQCGLIYVLKGSSLYIYATSAIDMPVDRDNIYLAPFHNVSQGGSVCLGSANAKKPKENTYEAIIHYYESLFWNSEFSHLTGEESPVVGNLNTFWKNSIKYGTECDISKLHLNGQNFKTLLNAILK